jgi:hypothetical protein
MTIANEHQRRQMLLSQWPTQFATAAPIHPELTHNTWPISLNLPKSCLPFMINQNPLSSNQSQTAAASGFGIAPNFQEGLYPNSHSNQLTALPATMCRFCNCKFSSSSNRHRHERIKHLAELQSTPEMSTPSAGTSRKQSCEEAFAHPVPLISVAAPNYRLGSAMVAMEVDQQQIRDQHSEALELEGVAAGDDSQAATVINHGAASKESNEFELQLVSEGEEAEEQAELLEAKEVELSDEHCAEFEQAVVDSEHMHVVPEIVQADASQSEEQDMVAAEHPQSQPPSPFSHDDQEEEEQEDVTLPMEPAANEVLLAEGARSLLQVEDLQAVCYPFLQWLASPCMTATEALVKAKRVKSMSQLAPIKSTLRFIFALLYENKTIDVINLEALLRLSVAQALYQAIVDRQVGSARTHQVFLLVKKLLVYLSTVQSTKSRQFVQPTAYESYLYVENICSESSNQRKIESRNRMVLGIPGARGALMVRKEAFQIPKTWSATGNAQTNMVAAKSTPLQQPPPVISRTAQHESNSHNHVMTKEELSTVTQACLAYLNNSVAAELGQALSNHQTAEGDSHFMNHLVTATLCLGLAPRSQVLQQLRIGSSLAKEADGLYWIRMLAEQSKNKRPTMFALASQLTPAYDVYLQFVRPRLLSRAAEHIGQHDYVFFKHSGAAPRSDFSASTCLVTQKVLGRPVNAHAFRASVITTFYSSGATEAEMSMLASIMAHDPSTQRNFYYKPQQNEAAKQASERMVNQLLLPAPS